ncbi:MAG TPA: MlaD family protein [Terriglobales bacterium]|nr:MlaD family protein [Terriglobales bacterium]
MPTQKELKWSEMRVGLTVLFACIVMAVLIFLMSKTTGLFTPKLILKAYFENASGLRVGAPVRLEGVDIGNATAIGVDPSRPLTPVVVTMKVATKYRMGLRKDSVATLETAGVLGETFVDISNKEAKGPEAQDGDVLKTREEPAIQDVVRASQSTLQNVDILVRRLDRIVSAIERGEGSIGKVIYDPTLYNKLNATLDEVQHLVGQISEGRGSIGKLINSDELYNKLDDSVDKLNKLVDEIDQGKGTVGKLMKDPSLYNNANQTIAKANKLMEDVNAGKGALGKFAADPEFAKKLDDTIANLKIISDRLAAGEGSAGLLLKDPSLYTNADQMLVETRNLVKAVRENPKKYLTIHFKIF